MVKRGVLRGLMFVLVAGVLASAGGVQAGEVDKPGSGVEKTMKYFRGMMGANINEVKDLITRCDGGLIPSPKATIEENADWGAGAARGAQEAIHKKYPGSTFGCMSYSGSIIDGADTTEFSAGKPWKETFQGYAGITNVLNFLEYPMVTARSTLGDKFIQIIVNVDKNTISFVDSSLSLNITGAGNILGTNSAISENQLNAIMEKLYPILHGPTSNGTDSVMMFINAMLASNSYRKEFVSLQIPMLIKRAKARGEAEAW